MEFSSLVFVFLFLPLFLLLFFLLKPRAQQGYLFFAGLVFYAWGEGGYLFLLLVSTAGNYILGWFMDRTGEKAFSRKLFFTAALLFNLGLLLYFKYTHFILESLGLPVPGESIHLPLGISFFTFQAISYIVDTYRKTVPNDTHPVRFGLYMTFFPRLITGPIVPYHNFSRQLTAPPRITPEDISEGVKRFILGLGKKVLIADTVARTANHVFAIPIADQTAGLAWLGLLSYTLQIYFDFSGYTDMAVGLGRMLGYKLPENFNYPYIANSIKDFWARWHISLAQWLRDYLFLPIAYATLRRIKADRVLGIKAENWAYFAGALITFLLCGLWHGAAWTFVLWGGYYGILLVIEHLGLRKWMKRKAPYLRVFYCQLLVTIGWVFFRSPDLDYAFGYLGAMCGFSSGGGNLYYPALYLDREIVFFTVLGVMGCFPIFPKLKARFEGKIQSWKEKGQNTGARLLYSLGLTVYNIYLTSVLFFCAVALVGGTFNPFIYFRF